jgi:hypothetical protein
MYPHNGIFNIRMEVMTNTRILTTRLIARALFMQPKIGELIKSECKISQYLLMALWMTLIYNYLYFKSILFRQNAPFNAARPPSTPPMSNVRIINPGLEP